MLGPGAANNSKEGGDLIPTIAFGVPGSGAMAILLGAFLIMGLHPGPDMLTKHLAVTYSMVWTLVIANVITVIALPRVLPYLAQVTRIRGSLIIPFLLLLVFVGSYTANRQLADLLVTLASARSVTSWCASAGRARRWSWASCWASSPRPTCSFRWRAMAIGWLTQPLVMVLILIMAVVIAYPYVQQRRQRKREPLHA